MNVSWKKSHQQESELWENPYFQEVHRKITAITPENSGKENLAMVIVDITQ